MKTLRIFVILVAATVLSIHADESNVTLTVDGVTYSNVTFGTVSPSAVTIRHSSGIEKIPLWKLPPDLRKRFGYEPQKAADWQKAQQQAAATQAADQEQAKQRAEWLNEHAATISGVVTDVIQGKGVILSNEHHVETYIQYGGTDPRLMQTSYCFLQCDTKDLVDGSIVSCTAYPDGIYTYTTVMGASKTIKRWVYFGKYDPSKGGGSYGY